MKTDCDTTDYEKIASNDKMYENSIEQKQTKPPWKILFRQVLVCSTMWTLYFIYGLQLGAPTVIVSQMRKDVNSTTKIDDELASWIISAVTFGAVPWILILPVLYQLLGRKVSTMFVCSSGFIGALVIYLSKTVTQLLIGELIFGIILGSHMTNSPLIVSEYTSPEYRGVFLTIKSASVFWGIWVAITIGTFWHWKNIYLAHFVCNVYTLTIFAWPESFYWLAKKERYEECKKSHRWMKGTSRNAEKELVKILNYYKSDQQKSEIHKWYSVKKTFYCFLDTVTNTAFYKPLLFTQTLAFQYIFMGKIVCSMYAIQILKKITRSEDSAYKGMLILDGVTVFATYCGCFMSKYCKRRTMLFSTSTVAIIFLYIIALYLYLVHISVLTENSFISISLLSIFSLTVCSAPMILVSSIYSELIPVRYQRSCIMISGSISNFVSVILFKTAPSLFRVFTVSGAFLFFAVSSSILTLILYLYLPETKDKTLTEIEEYFSGRSKLDKKETSLMQQSEI